MSARSVHEAAVEAGAAGLCVRDGEGCPAHHLCEAEARRVIVALVASAEVREARVRCLLWGGVGLPCADRSSAVHRECFLAALGGTEAG